LTLARNAQKEFLIGQSSVSHVTYRWPIWLIPCWLLWAGMLCWL